MKKEEKVELALQIMTLVDIGLSIAVLFINPAVAAIALAATVINAGIFS